MTKAVDYTKKHYYTSIPRYGSGDRNRELLTASEVLTVRVLKNARRTYRWATLACGHERELPRTKYAVGEKVPCLKCPKVKP